MTTITSIIVLKALAKHETLTLPDLIMEQNLGITIPSHDVENALVKLREQKLVDMLDGTNPPTYTITNKGIEEDKKIRL
jgi:hypothetical protein